MKVSAMQAAALRLAIVFCATACLAAGRAAAQGVGIYVKLDGIKGEATAKGYEGTIAASSIHMDLKNIGGTTATGGATAGKAQFGDFVITKPVDSASPQLFMNCATGKLIRTAVISLLAPGDQPVEFLKYTLSDVLISSVSVSASGEAPTEQVTLAYSRIEIEYKPIGPDGKPGAPVKSGYDIKSGKVVSAGGTGNVVASSGGATESTGGEAPPADAQADAGDAAMPPESGAETPPAPQQTEPAPTARTRTGDAAVRAPYGNQLIGLPIGTYYVRVAGQSEPVTIADGKVTEF